MLPDPLQEVSKLNNKYRAALQTMQLNYTKQGDLEAALAVKNEIEKLPVIGVEVQKIADTSVFSRNLRIFEATYGSGGTRINVKPKIEGAIREDKLDVILNKELLGDPIPNYQ